MAVNRRDPIIQPQPQRTMPFVWNKEVDTYTVSVFEASTLNYDRSLSLKLKASGGDPAQTVSIRFPISAPSDNISIGSTFSTIQLPKESFDEMYHVLQTEKPVFFTAYETGSPPIRFAGLTTDPEATGEGFADPS